jgi:hypothetical protein
MASLEKVFCCEEYKKNTGERSVGFETYCESGDKEKVVTSVNGCCGGGCFVLNDIKHCPFCGAEIKYK